MGKSIFSAFKFSFIVPISNHPVILSERSESKDPYPFSFGRERILRLRGLWPLRSE